MKKSWFGERTIPAVAKRLGISATLLYAACNDGEVKTITFGGQRRIPPAEEERIRITLAELEGKLK